MKKVMVSNIFSLGINRQVLYLHFPTKTVGQASNVMIYMIYRALVRV